MQKIIGFILLLTSNLVSASDMGGLGYFVSVPISLIALIIAFVISDSARSSVGYIGLIVCAVVSCFLGITLLVNYPGIHWLPISQFLLLISLIIPIKKLYSKLHELSSDNGKKNDINK